MVNPLKTSAPRESLSDSAPADSYSYSSSHSHACSTHQSSCFHATFALYCVNMAALSLDCFSLPSDPN